MDKCIKDKIIMEFEIAIRATNDEAHLENIEILKNKVNSDNLNDMSYLNICLELMQTLTREINVTNKSQSDERCLLSDEEKHFLSSIYH